MDRAEWASARKKLRICTILFACMAGLNVFPAIEFHLNYGIAAVICAAFALVMEGLRFGAWRRMYGLVGVGAAVVAPVTVLVTFGQLFLSGVFFLFSPLAMLDDSPNTDGHIQSKILSIWLLSGIWFVSALLGGCAAWQLFRVSVCLQPGEASPEEVPASG